MDQYGPAGRVAGSEFVEIQRRITRAEYEAALQAARRAGLWRFDSRKARVLVAL
jgi:uncharacterized Fe-S radical SAM superfamily protein PflX